MATDALGSMPRHATGVHPGAGRIDAAVSDLHALASAKQGHDSQSRENRQAHVRPRSLLWLKACNDDRFQARRM